MESSNFRCFLKNDDPLGFRKSLAMDVPQPNCSAGFRTSDREKLAASKVVIGATRSKSCMECTDIAKGEATA